MGRTPRVHALSVSRDRPSVGPPPGLVGLADDERFSRSLRVIVGISTRQAELVGNNDADEIVDLSRHDLRENLRELTQQRATKVSALFWSRSVQRRDHLSAGEVWTGKKTSKVSFPKVA